MSDDLPPGVRGPIPDPTKVAQASGNEVQTTFPDMQLKSVFNPLTYGYRFFNLVFEVPTQAVRSSLEKFRGPGNRQRRCYHQKFRRVPNIWECATDDYVCIYEARTQFNRDKSVETEMVNLLEQRKKNCKIRHPTTYEEHCREFFEEFYLARKNWMIKYGDLGARQNPQNVLNKQKNRLIEARYKERMGIVDDKDFLPGPFQKQGEH